MSPSNQASVYNNNVDFICELLGLLLGSVSRHVCDCRIRTTLLKTDHRHQVPHVATQHKSLIFIGTCYSDRVRTGHRWQGQSVSQSVSQPSPLLLMLTSRCWQRACPTSSEGGSFSRSQMNDSSSTETCSQNTTPLPLRHFPRAMQSKRPNQKSEPTTRHPNQLFLRPLASLFTDQIPYPIVNTCNLTSIRYLN